MLFFRVIQHLLPRARAWALVINRTLRRFFEGLAAGVPDAARQALDDVYDDLRPATTRQIPEWLDQFGLQPAATEELQRTQISAAWQARGGQSPSYIQATLQAAGFPVFVHEWWEPGSEPRTVRDPHDYTDEPLEGTIQCGDEPEGICGNPEAQCNDWAANDPGYIVNLRLTPEAQPTIPTDPARWRHFMYIGGESFPDVAVVDPDRLEELKALILKIKPGHVWVVLLLSTGSIVIEGFTIDSEVGALETLTGVAWATQDTSAANAMAIGLAFTPDTDIGVAVGNEGRVLRTEDLGVTGWDVVHAGDHATLDDALATGVTCAGGGVCVLVAMETAAGVSLIILRSTDDGETWIDVTDTLVAGISGIAAISDIAPIAFESWVRCPKIASGGGLIVATVTTGAGTIVSLVSADGGDTWSAFAVEALLGAPVSGQVRYLNGAFYLVATTDGSDSVIYRSVDGETWTKVTLTGGVARDIAYAGGTTLVAIGDDSAWRSTNNGTSWGAAAVVDKFDAAATTIVSNGSQLVVFGDDLGPVLSTDAGVTWLATGPVVDETSALVAHEGGLWRGQTSGSASSINYSDLTEWETAFPAIEGQRSAFVFNASGIGLSAGTTPSNEGFIARSTIAREWVDTYLSDLIPGLDEPLFGCAVAGSAAVMVGVDTEDSNSLLAIYSADGGATWDRTATDLSALEMTVASGSYRGSCVAYGNGRFVAAGNDSAGGFNAAYSVDDGETWTAVPAPIAMSGRAITRLRFLDGAFYAILGAIDLSGAFVLRSVDGATWTIEELPIEGSAVLALDIALVAGELVVIGADEVTVTFTTTRWISDDDGATWTRSEMTGFVSDMLPATLTHFNGELFAGCLSVGAGGASVHRSDDSGDTWTPVSDDIDLGESLAGIVDLTVTGDRLTGSRGTWFFSSI